MCDYGFVENEDYKRFTQKKVTLGGEQETVQVKQYDFSYSWTDGEMEVSFRYKSIGGFLFMRKISMLAIILSLVTMTVFADTSHEAS